MTIAVLSLVSVAGCSNGDDPIAADADSIDVPAGTVGPDENEPDENEPDEVERDENATVATAPASDPEPTAATATSVVTTTTTEPARPFGDVALIDATTPTEGNGATPTLAWQLIEGATSYSVIVLDPDGTAWWAWEGPEREVVLGGVADGPGALVVEAGATWTVIAFDAAGSVLAASLERRLDP